MRVSLPSLRKPTPPRERKRQNPLPKVGLMGGQARVRTRWAEPVRGDERGTWEFPEDGTLVRVFRSYDPDMSSREYHETTSLLPDGRRRAALRSLRVLDGPTQTMQSQVLTTTSCRRARVAGEGLPPPWPRRPQRPPGGPPDPRARSARCRVRASRLPLLREERPAASPRPRPRRQRRGLAPLTTARSPRRLRLQQPRAEAFGSGVGRYSRRRVRSR